MNQAKHPLQLFIFQDFKAKTKKPDSDPEKPATDASRFNFP